MSNVNFNFGSKDDPRGVGIVAIHNGDIYVNNEKIGVSKSKYNELVDQLDEYYQILLENGLIEEELTVEDKLDKALATLDQTNQTNALLAELNQQLLERVERLEKGSVSNAQNAVSSKTADAEINNAQGQNENITSDRTSSTSISDDAGKGARGKPRGNNIITKGA